MTVLCYGDSNTYGFDPRSWLGERYPADVRWTGLLARKTGWTILEEGENGREIPTRPGDLAELARLSGRADVTAVMLGTNDLLANARFTAEDVTVRIQNCLEALTAVRPASSVLLIAPPPMVPGTWVGEGRLLRESARLADCCRRLADCCRRLAAEQGTAFADAGQWGASLLFDGVHFSPEGHRAFADGIRRALELLAADRS